MTALFALLSAEAALAGSWTKTSPEGQVTGKTYYVGDNGGYVRSSWVFVDGVWYWLQGDGSLPTAYGISQDGYIFNEKGIYVPSATGSAYQYHDDTLNGAGGTYYSQTEGTIQGTTAHAASTSVNGRGSYDSWNSWDRGPGVSGSGSRTYRTSDYGPGAGYVSDPHR